MLFFLYYDSYVTDRRHKKRTETMHLTQRSSITGVGVKKHIYHSFPSAISYCWSECTWNVEKPFPLWHFFLLSCRPSCLLHCAVHCMCPCIHVWRPTVCTCVWEWCESRNHVISFAGCQSLEAFPLGCSQNRINMQYLAALVTETCVAHTH